MTEPKRATWREFVEWVAQIEWETSGAGSECWSAKRLRAAACVATTRGEAVAAVIGAMDQDPGDVDYLIDRWLGSLRDGGISPPQTTPSVAKTLEIVAGEIADAGDTFCADLSGDEAQQVRLAFGCSVAIVRTLARDFA